MRSGQVRTLMLCPGFYGVILMTKDVIQLLEK